MPEGFRFRTNWRGKLILQRLDEWTDCTYPDYSHHQYSAWRDAGAEDMSDFFKLKEKTQ